MDIALALAVAVLVVAMGYMGVHVTLHPQDDPRRRLWWKVGFIGVGAVSVALIGWQAYIAHESTTNLDAAIHGEGQLTREALKDLKTKESTKPIQSPSSKRVVVQIPPKPENQKIALRNKAVELSAEILSFLGERNRTGLQNFSLQNTGFGKDMSIADSQKLWDAETKRVNTYQQETVNLFNNEFRDRARLLLAEMKIAGVDVDRAWYLPGDPGTIQKFATDLAAVARDIR